MNFEWSPLMSFYSVRSQPYQHIQDWGVTLYLVWYRISLSVIFIQSTRIFCFVLSSKSQTIGGYFQIIVLDFELRLIFLKHCMIILSSVSRQGYLNYRSETCNELVSLLIRCSLSVYDRKKFLSSFVNLNCRNNYN